jgi:hypothetical protein
MDTLTQRATPLVSVIVVAYNPRSDLLSWALDSLEAQTFPKSQFEVIVVDNNSNPPLDESRLRDGRSLQLRLLREPRQGNTFARCTGISDARSDVLVFVDDDNHIDNDYLQKALSIATTDPSLGAFGGKARPVLEGPLPAWKERLLPYLGIRDFGPNHITSRERCWGEWEPIGAGMVFRRDVGEEYVRWVALDGATSQLGRKAHKGLMSGEDALIAQAAYRLGYACSYQPSLAMSHCMKQTRMQVRILARTMEGHGRSFVLLQSIIGWPVPKPGLAKMSSELFQRFVHHVRDLGFRAGAVKWFWDLGYFRQARR